MEHPGQKNISLRSLYHCFRMQYVLTLEQSQMFFYKMFAFPTSSYYKSGYMGDFSQNLQAIMDRRGLNANQLSKRAGISRGLISGYLNERGRDKYPSLKNLIALSEALHCTLEELTGIERAKGAEEAAGAVQPSDKELAILRAYSKLPDDHWLKKAIDQVLLTGDLGELTRDNDDSDDGSITNPKQ